MDHWEPLLMRFALAYQFTWLGALIHAWCIPPLCLFYSRPKLLNDCQNLLSHCETCAVSLSNWQWRVALEYGQLFESANVRACIKNQQHFRHSKISSHSYYRQFFIPVNFSHQVFLFPFLDLRVRHGAHGLGYSSSFFYCQISVTFNSCDWQMCVYPFSSSL